jgi:addiction module HigA family antidote
MIDREAGEIVMTTHRQPSSPGEILLKEFLEPAGLSQVELARRLEIPIQRINTIVNEKRAITAETALLLADALGTTAEFWLNLQMQLDLSRARQRFGRKTARGAGVLRRTASKRSPASVPREGTRD